MPMLLIFEPLYQQRNIYITWYDDNAHIKDSAVCAKGREIRFSYLWRNAWRKIWRLEQERKGHEKRRGRGGELRVDLGRMLVFSQIVDSPLRPCRYGVVVQTADVDWGASEEEHKLYISDGRLQGEGLGYNTASCRGRMISVEAVSD